MVAGVISSLGAVRGRVMRVQLLVLASVMVLLSGCASTGRLSRTLSHQATKPPADAHIQDSTGASISNIQTSRYVKTSTRITSYQMNLLDQTLSIRFPFSVKTISQALNYLLRFSGYSLVGKHSRSQAMNAILSQPLPEVLRHIDNTTLKASLLSLVGSDFQLLYDPVHRLVSFALKPQSQLIFSKKDES